MIAISAILFASCGNSTTEAPKASDTTMSVTDTTVAPIDSTAIDTTVAQ